MKNILILTLLFTAIGSLSSYAQISIKNEDAGNLIEDLMKSADVTKEQAQGGAGALFEMAQGGLATKDFDQIAQVIPDMDGLLNAVPALKGGSSSSMLGTATTALVGMPKVLAVFDKLGISQDKVALFTPLLVSYVEKKGGALLGSKLANVFN